MTRQRIESPATEPPVQAPENVKQIRVVWGEEVHQPIQYNGFRVGPIEVLVEVLPGESAAEVYERTYAWLDSLGKDQFRRKVSGFLGRLAEASTITKKNAAPR